MNKNDINDIYDASVAGDYTQRLLSEKNRVDFELGVLAELINVTESWLDVACGTGYFLSQFSGKNRAGFDVATAMVDVARKLNPDADFIRVGDYRDKFPEWKGKWGLVTCMWQAYNYVNTVSELEEVIKNLASWTADEGICYVPYGCPLGSKPGIPYQRPAYSPWGGAVMNSAVVWSWKDEKQNKIHSNLIEPHPEHMMSMFNDHFNLVEVIGYPSRNSSAIIATDKKNSTSSGSMRSIVEKVAEQTSAK